MLSPLKVINEQRRLLRLEYEDEKRAFSKLTEDIGITRLLSRGDAWIITRVGRTWYNSLNQRVVEVFRDEEEDADHHFEYSRPVTFFIKDSDDKLSFPFSGTVSFVDANRMAVVIPESASLDILMKVKECGVILSFDETTYKAMFEALDRVASAKGRLGELRDFFYSGREVTFLNLPPVSIPFLNASQQEGVRKILCAKDLAILHGPPGTGKTTTLVEAIHETLRREPQVLVCAQSNMAVDWICEKLVDRGIHVLRLGNPARVNDKMLAFSYERRFEDHPDYPDLWALRKSMRQLRSSGRKGGDRRKRLDALQARATELEIRINNDLLSSAHVIASTLTGSSSRLLSGLRFTSVFIDEAAQALEAAAWIPIRRAGRVILAGDHCQLPPTVKSYEAMREGLGRSLMERLVGNHPEAVTLLNTQYRMHEDIMRFSSDWFYHSAMQAAPEVRYRGLLDLDIPIEWIDTTGRTTLSSSFSSSASTSLDNPVSSVFSETSGNPGTPDVPNSSDNTDCSNLPDDFREALAQDSLGRINKAEATLTLRVLREYITRIGKRRFLDERFDIGLISPYRAQVRYIRHLLKRHPFFKPFRHLISVDTVDGFQGQERDIIVISLVRSNDKGDIGFLRDLRRMNVAMTRARMKLLIIGSGDTLTRHPFYRHLHRYIRHLRANVKHVYGPDEMSSEP